MPEIHPTSIIDGEATLADDVVIGPGCVLSGPVALGPGTRLIGHVYLTGPLTMGRDNLVYPFACIGFAPQHAKYDPREPGLGTTIGDRNTFREHATVHRAFAEDHPTTIGDRNFFMAGSHVGHDSRVGDDCTLVQSAMLGGHAVVDNRVTIGGTTGVHQWCRVGRGAMLRGGVATSVDVPPFFMLTGINVVGGVNLVGLRRGGFARDEIDDVRWAYRVLCRQNLSMTTAIEALRARSDRPLIREYIDFIESSKRGIATGRPRPARGTI